MTTTEVALSPRDQLEAAAARAVAASSAVPGGSRSPIMFDLIDNAIDALGQIEKAAEIDKLHSDIRRAETLIAEMRYKLRDLLGLDEDGEIPSV